MSLSSHALTQLGQSQPTHSQGRYAKHQAGGNSIDTASGGEKGTLDNRPGLFMTATHSLIGLCAMNRMAIHRLLYCTTPPSVLTWIL